MAPAGTGRTMDPTMVPRKIASSRHDFGVMPSGTGARRMPATVMMTMPHRTTTSRRERTSTAPWVTGGALGAVIVREYAADGPTLVIGVRVELHHLTAPARRSTAAAKERPAGAVK